MSLRTILIIYIALNLALKKKSYNDIFVEKNHDEKLEGIVEELKVAKNNMFGNNLFKMMLLFVFCFELLFYIFSVMYINNIIFSIISLLFVMYLIYSTVDVFKVIKNDDYRKRNGVYDKIKFFVDLAYNLFVLVQIFV